MSNISVNITELKQLLNRLNEEDPSLSQHHVSR